MIKKSMATAVESAMEWLWWQWQEIKPGPWWEKSCGECPVPVKFSTTGAIMEVHGDFFKTEQWRWRLGEVRGLRMAAENPFFMNPYPSSTIADQIREKYRGDPYVDKS